MTDAIAALRAVDRDIEQSGAVTVETVEKVRAALRPCEGESATANDADFEARQRVAAALGLGSGCVVNGKRVSFAWEYLIPLIEEAVKIAEEPSPSAERSQDAGVTELKPKWEGEFKSYEQWVNKGQSWLKSPSHRPAICIDTKGRRCAIGADMMRARDEGAFPVRYFWEFEVGGAQTTEGAV